MKDKDKTTTYVPIVFMLPTILGPILCDEGKTSSLLHGIVKVCLEPQYTEVKRIVHFILEWMIWSYVKGKNEDSGDA